MRSTLRLSIARLVLLAAFCGATAMTTTSIRAQQDEERLERLRQEQQDILRKTERLQALMTRLRQRYEREGKQEQVDLLTAGLEHLTESSILRDVAGIRDDLGATALSEALRKQSKVIEDLEQLLNILLDRRSVESIAEAARMAAERAATARQLEQRQRDLQQQTNEALRSEPTAAQQELIDNIESLADAERNEADRNNRESGMRRPFLEAALERIARLLGEEQRLADALAAERDGARSQAQRRQFDLGELIQQTRDLAGQIRGQDRQSELAEAARTLSEQTEGTDAQALQEARHRFEALVQDAPKLPGSSEGQRSDPEWQQLGEQLRQARAGETAAERKALEDIAEAGTELAERRGAEAAERNANQSQRLAEGARELAETLAEESGRRANEPEESTPSESLRTAAEALEAAQAAAQAGKTDDAQRAIDRALSTLEAARRQHAADNPDAERQAGRMAAESTAVARELDNSPRAQDAERQASEQLQDATEQLRDLERTIAEARQEGERPDQAASSAQAREQLEQAQRTLEEALEQATEGREDELQQAAARQQQLAEQAQQTAEAMQRAAENSDLTEQQASAASQAMQQAQQSMQRAEQSLRNGQQSQAAQQQQQAAEQLQQAAEQLQQDSEPTAAQKQQLAEQAATQEQLAEDIIRLAELLEEQDQQAARRKLDEAAEAAQRAQQAMERGDAQEAQQEQEEARQKLEEAAEELEEERDRYQDMRQEELLFKMKEELLAFLERQRPITAATLEAQKAAENGRLSRPTRRKINRLGEEEFELAGRIDFLIQALTDEGNLVYQTVLRANLEDLQEIGERLSGRSPDVGSFTTLMQHDVERRSEELLVALENERKRREQQRQEQQQQQQQQQGENRFNPQRERLVSLIAELEMLKTLLEDTSRATNDLHVLISSRSDENITESEVALVERLAHRHAEITKLFVAIKTAVEETMQAMEQDQQQGSGR